jgi:hypothetical protein
VRNARASASALGLTIGECPRILMAQWIGLGSGATHATKVKDLEESLRAAIAALKSTSDDDGREAKVRTIQNLSRRLLSARLHLIGSRLTKAKEKQAHDESKLLREREIACEREGTKGILKEFGFGAETRK